MNHATHEKNFLPHMGRVQVFMFGLVTGSTLTMAVLSTYLLWLNGHFQ